MYRKREATKNYVFWGHFPKLWLGIFFENSLVNNLVGLFMFNPFIIKVYEESTIKKQQRKFEKKVTTQWRESRSSVDQKSVN